MNKIILSLLLFINILILIVSNSIELNDWPIIGIFAQPTTSTQGDCAGSCQYIAASYVKYIEAAGARVVPINYYSTTNELDELFNNLNGFFFPGGSSSFPSSAQYIFDKIVEANDNGDFIPLWGTCMGFQWLLISAARDDAILDPSKGVLDSYNYSIPLEFTSEASSSRLFGKAPLDVVKILSSQNVTLNNHHYGIYPDHLQSIDSLSSFYNVLSVNEDRAGVSFVSTIESFDYPIYGTQWHPEKNIYEWGKTNGIPNEAINHSPEAILISQYTANFFVEQARKCSHSYSNADEEDDALISNYAPTKTTGSFQESYYFHF